MSDEKVVPLYTPESDLVWMCGCGNQSFFIHGDGHVECVDCNAPQEGLGDSIKKLWPDNDR
jgi:hypothetical protein